MSSRMLAGILAAGCVTAAASGAYVAVRQNATEPVPVATAPATPAAPAGRPVSETEAIIAAQAPANPQAREATAPAPRSSGNRVHEERRSAPPIVQRGSVEPTRDRPVRTAPTPVPAGPAERPSLPAPAPPVEAPQEPVRVTEPTPGPPVSRFEEVVLPTSSVMGLQVDTPLSSERARIEDRVDARVTRDVVAAGRVAFPAGSRVIGAVTLVERGGKMKQTARLGVRFHTLVLADGREISLRTEPVYREGESPAAESTRKIGGAAIGGAILGAIMGGGKGAVIGGATGAAGGSAAVMAGDRNAATLPSGTVVTVRLSAPATIEIEKREQQY